jgi:hypothetical protein
MCGSEQGHAPDPKDYENWRMKRIPYLERVIKINFGKTNFIMKTLRRNCINGNLYPSLTDYKSWGKGSGGGLTLLGADGLSV